MPRESKLVTQILGAYRSRGAYAVKIHGERYQPVTIDIIACYRGVFVALEAKREYGMDATPLQQEILRQVRNAFGSTAVVHDVDEALAELDKIDTRFERSVSMRELLSRFASMGNPEDYPRRPQYPQQLDIPFEWFEDAFKLIGDGRHAS